MKTFPSLLTSLFLLTPHSSLLTSLFTPHFSLFTLTSHLLTDTVSVFDRLFIRLVKNGPIFSRISLSFGRFGVRIWLVVALLLLILPVPVTENRFAAPRCVFNLLAFHHPCRIYFLAK